MDVTLSPRARVVIVWIAVIFGGLVLFGAAHALRPFAWAIITAYIFHPLVSFIHRKTHLPKHLITAWLYLMLGLVFAIVVINLTPLLVDQLKGLRAEIPNVAADVQTWIQTHENSRLAQLDIQSFIDQRLSEIAQIATSKLSAHALPFLISTVSVLIETVIYLIASFYLIVHGDRFVLAIRGLLNRRYHREFDRLLLDINTTLGAYLRGQVILVLIMSTASFIVLKLLQVDFALSVAIATGFLELIPLVGPWTAGSIAVLIALFQDSTPFGWSHATLALVVGLLYFALRQLEDTFVIPLVIGRIVHLHPLLVIFVIVVGTTLGGVLGLILAVPIAAVVKIVGTFFYNKLKARESRHVEVIRREEDLKRIVERFPSLINATVVLLIEPDVLHWNDLQLVQDAAESALDHAVALSVVTPDGIAGALTTAAGITTTTVPISAPVSIQALGR